MGVVPRLSVQVGEFDSSPSTPMIDWRTKKNMERLLPFGDTPLHVGVCCGKARMGESAWHEGFMMIMKIMMNDRW